VESSEIGSHPNKNLHRVIGIIDEEFDVIESISLMELGEKPPRRLFRRR
jgi:hypothetical protein